MGQENLILKQIAVIKDYLGERKSSLAADYYSRTLIRFPKRVDYFLMLQKTQPVYVSEIQRRDQSFYPFNTNVGERICGHTNNTEYIDQLFPIKALWNASDCIEKIRVESGFVPKRDQHINSLDNLVGVIKRDKGSRQRIIDMVKKYDLFDYPVPRIALLAELLNVASVTPTEEEKITELNELCQKRLRHLSQNRDV